jgi:hypothetical protein
LKYKLKMVSGLVITIISILSGWILADNSPMKSTNDKEYQTMFYKAKSQETGNMWDTWLYYQEGTYYLYYLANSESNWDNISMATSADGVHWKELGRILSKGEGVTWMGTGSTWKSPNFENDGKFQINFSEWKGPRQTIFFAESKDLIHWTRLGDEYEFKQDERWYEPNGRWDCIWVIPRPEGGLYGYWTATPKPETEGKFGFGETIDGVTWKALAPPKVYGVGDGEVGAIEKIGDKYYMMFGTDGIMMTLIADKPDGPFHIAKKNFRLLSGHTYFSRFFLTPDGVLASHHSIARDRQVYFGLPKQAVVDNEGTLRLGWWKGNEKMKRERVDVKLSDQNTDKSIVMLENIFDTDKGLIMEGTLIISEDKIPKGLYIECVGNQGSAILVGANGVTDFGTIQADGSGFASEKHVDREMIFGKSAKFRLLLKHSLLEFYLDNILIECFSLPAKSTGRIGLIQGVAIKDIQAW